MRRFHCRFRRILLMTCCCTLVVGIDGDDRAFGQSAGGRYGTSYQPVNTPVRPVSLQPIVHAQQPLQQIVQPYQQQQQPPQPVGGQVAPAVPPPLSARFEVNPLAGRLPFNSGSPGQPFVPNSTGNQFPVQPLTSQTPVALHNSAAQHSSVIPVAAAHTTAPVQPAGYGYSAPPASSSYVVPAGDNSQAAWGGQAAWSPPQAYMAGVQTPDMCSTARFPDTFNYSTCNYETSYTSGIPSNPVGLLHFDTPLSAYMLDFQNPQSNKELALLANKRGATQSPTVIMGAQLRASAIAGRTNTDNSFSYLGRFPPDFTSRTVTDVRLLHANQSFVAHATPWVSGYLETLFSDVFSFPSFNQGSFQMRQAYVTLGNLEESSLYAYIGKKNVGFGDMSTLSPFTQSVVWHYFGGLAEGAGVGYHEGGLTATIAGLNGSRGVRVVDSEEKGHVNNFVANASLTVPLADDTDFTFGGGYMHGTIYNARIAEHLDPSLFDKNNAAWDMNAMLRVGGFRAAAEFVTTTDDWPVVNHRVQAYRTEAAYDFNSMDTPCRLSASWSEGLQGDSGTEFESNAQFVLGLRVDTSPNVYCTFEYVRSLGFAPLINITTVSNADVIQNSFVLGLVMAI